MPCYHPREAFYSLRKTKTGKQAVVFNREYGVGEPFKVPCGQCLGCRLERSRQWAIRCQHEAQMHDNNCFITLTYSDQYLPRVHQDPEFTDSPYNSTLVKRHFQLFMKRLRKRYGEGIRYFMCGEYGSKLGRPHYHAILFNHDFPRDVEVPRASKHKVYRSFDLESLWPYGYSSIGDMSFDSAAYVARYCTKKVNGIDAITHYSVITEDGEYVGRRLPEYNCMSRRPGIAKPWFDKFHSDAYPSDSIHLPGKTINFKPPKYYDSLFEVLSPDEFKEIKERRVENAKKHADNNTSERLVVREKIAVERFNLLNRPLY